MHVALDLGCEFVLSHLQVLARLKIHPENGRVLKVAREPESGVGGDPAPLAHDVGNPRDRDRWKTAPLIFLEVNVYVVN